MRPPMPSSRLPADYYLDGGFTLLDHGHGVSTCYLHQSKRMVKAGDTVARGEVIGLVGQTGRATGPHTHWGLNWFQVKLDPSLSTPRPSRPRPERPVCGAISMAVARAWASGDESTAIARAARARMASMASLIAAVSASTSRS